MNFSSQTNACFTCSRIICAVPPSSVNRIDFSPPLPPVVSDAFANFSMGAAIKFTLAYERPHWREEGAEGGFSGETMAAVARRRELTTRTLPDTRPRLVTTLVEVLHLRQAVLKTQASR